MAKGDRGSRGRKEYGSGSDHRRGTTYRDRDRADRNRDRYRERQQEQSRLAAEKKAREEAERHARAEAERKAKEEAERRAKEEAERRAKEEAERKAKIAQKKAEAEAENKRSGFSPMGGLSSYGLSYADGGRGVLAKMRAPTDRREQTIADFNEDQQQSAINNYRDLTAGESKLGFTERDIYEGAGLGEDVSEQGVANTVRSAINEKGFDMAGNLLSAPFGPVGRAVKEGVSWALDAFDSSTDWQKAMKETAKSAMQGGDTIQNVGGAAQAATTFGAMKGVGFLKDIAPAVLSPVAGGVIGIADDIVANERFKSEHKDYLEQHGLLPDYQNTPRERGSDKRDGGILAGMLPKQPTPPDTPAASEPALPDFTWYEGDEFNTNYGMRFKR